MILQPTTPELFVGLPERYRRKVLCPIDKYTLEEITESIVNLYEIDPEKVFIRSRKGELVKARMIIIYLACQTERYTLKKLGSLIGLDHSTIIYYRDTVKDRMEVDKVFKAEIDRAAAVVCARWDAVQVKRISDILKPVDKEQEDFELQFYD